jgi:hypothetical protein
VPLHDDAPTADDDPVGHFKQSGDPTVPAYVPAKHFPQLYPAEEDVPNGQDVHDGPASDDDNPIGHFVHAVAVKVSV